MQTHITTNCTCQGLHCKCGSPRYFTDEAIVQSIFAVCKATNNTVEWYLNRYSQAFNYQDALAVRRLAPLHNFPKHLYNNCI